MKISSNKKIIIDENDESSIYIKEEFIEEMKESNMYIFNYLTKLRENSRIKKLENYSKFTNKLNFSKYDNDCLILAESIISKNIENPNYKKSLLRVVEEKERLFGYTDKQNIKIANDIKKKSNEIDYTNINPNIMDAYVIMPVELIKDSGNCPYHVAAVILKDGDTNITLEADAGCKLKKGVFDMYSTVNKDETFYRRYKSNYTVNRKIPVGGLLKLRE